MKRSAFPRRTNGACDGASASLLTTFWGQLGLCAFKILNECGERLCTWRSVTTGSHRVTQAGGRALFCRGA